LRTLAHSAARWPARPTLEADSHGVIPRVNLSVKVTALTARVRAEAPELGIADAKHRLRNLLRTAKDVGAHLHVDMESMDSRDLITELVIELLNEPEFRDGPSAGIVLQAYLRDADEQLDRLLEGYAAAERSLPLTIRLVKGAYWEHETVEARQNGWTSPVFEAKVESDRNFERITRRLIAEKQLVRPAIASHNVRSIAHALAHAENPRDIEFQVLRGLGDDLQVALAGMDLRVRTYCPVGDLVAGMSYLVRRLLENTSNDSFLLSRSRGDDLDQLLAAP
jgi:RHH-type proline utilization regulon transcriptional repressor/proline dehydrogenase/delta 1-pyrroline-5-carboxylate dehydrogenase